MSYLLSIIIPIKVTNKNKYLLKRLETLIYRLNKMQYDEIQYIIVDSSLRANYKNHIESICKKYINTLYFYLKIPKLYSASKARNHGVYNSSGEYILFYDVDLLVSSLFLKNILNDIKEFKTLNAFNVYPCLYLSEKKSKELELELRFLQNKTFEDIQQRYLQGFNDDTLYLAVNTSTILVQKKHFCNIGGYDENYKGHGYEDFELIHRLYIAYPIIERGNDYSLDIKTNFPAQYEGFRKHYAYYSLPNFFKGTYTLHLWHLRPLSKGYYRNRTSNAKYFLGQLNDSLKIPLTKKYLNTSISRNFLAYIDELHTIYNIDKTKYSGMYFLNPENINIKPQNSFQRKLRKFILNPKSFFLDMNKSINKIK